MTVNKDLIKIIKGLNNGNVSKTYDISSNHKLKVQTSYKADKLLLEVLYHDIYDPDKEIFDNRCMSPYDIATSYLVDQGILEWVKGGEGRIARECKHE